MTKREFERYFKQEVWPTVLASESRRGFRSKTDRRLAWNAAMENMHDIGNISDKQLQNWGQPAWLETLKGKGNA